VCVERGGCIRVVRIENGGLANYSDGLMGLGDLQDEVDALRLAQCRGYRFVRFNSYGIGAGPQLRESETAGVVGDSDSLQSRVVIRDGYRGLGNWRAAGIVYLTGDCAGSFALSESGIAPGSQ